MADPTSSPKDVDAEHGAEAHGEARPGTPRWVKVFGIVAALVVALLVVLLIAGHGPGRHATGLAAGQALPLRAELA